MKLELQPYKSDSVIVVKMDNKPKMAIAWENPKLREFPEEMRNANTSMMINWLLDLLGVNSNGDNVKHHAACFEFVNDSLLNYTYQEIKLAFQKYVGGEYYDSNGKPMLITQQLNAVVIGRVMREYEFLKKKELDTYRRKKEEQMRKDTKPTESDILVTMFINMLHYWDQFNEFKIIGDGGETVFDRLVEKNIIASPEEDKYKSYYAKKMKLAKDYLEMEFSTKKSLIRETRNDYKKILQDVKSGNSSRIETKAKCMVLEDYFKKLIDNEIDFKNVLREKWDIKIIENSKNNPL